jgi:hypothetical protein
MKRNYVVVCKRGRLPVTVSSELVSLRGERFAVAQVAWQKLMGQNALGEDVDKKLPTRKFLMDEINSHYESQRDSVWIKFATTIEFKLVSLGD